MSEKFGLSEKQTKAILDMQLRRLTGLQRDRIDNEYDEIIILIADLKDILANESRVRDIIRTDLLEVKENMEIQDKVKFQTKK